MSRKRQKSISRKTKRELADVSGELKLDDQHINSTTLVREKEELLSFEAVEGMDAAV